MPAYILTCDCGSTDFTYEEGIGFVCTDCDTVYDEDKAGKHLLED